MEIFCKTKKVQLVENADEGKKEEEEQKEEEEKESEKSQFQDKNKKKNNNIKSEQNSSVLPHSLRNFAVKILRILK